MAMALYEQLLHEDQTDSEAYWFMVLCRYGVEYVEDPTTHRQIPTINRAQYTSILADEDYRAALRYADAVQVKLYKQEAAHIDAIQKGILQVSLKEPPYDIFICYKETDENGQRTRDSVLADEIYYHLCKEGYRVFFSRITLQNKLGEAYEPYIFAALHSAKIMIVIGTDPQNIQSVWVKNEWSRYLSLIQKGESKILIPAYRDMAPYDLPDEFSHLQALNMAQLGFMQDLLHGVRKIIGDNPHAVMPAPNMPAPPPSLSRAEKIDYQLAKIHQLAVRRESNIWHVGYSTEPPEPPVFPFTGPEDPFENSAKGLTWIEFSSDAGLDTNGLSMFTGLQKLEVCGGLSAEDVKGLPLVSVSAYFDNPAQAASILEIREP